MAEDEGDSQLMLADEDLSSWADKISDKFFNMTGNNVKENVALKVVKIAANRQTIQLECPLETCHEKLTVYKELSAKGGKYHMSGLLMHIKRKHQLKMNESLSEKSSFDSSKELSIVEVSEDDSMGYIEITDLNVK